MNASQCYVKSYKIEDEAGVGQNLAVVFGAADGGVKKPAAANSAGFCGVTIGEQTRQGSAVPVQKSGIVRVKANGAGSRGDRLVIANTAGAVKSAESVVTHAPGTASVQNVVGVAECDFSDGDLIPMWIAPCVVNIAVS